MKTEYCITCDRPTDKHCRKCGLPLCPACANGEGICMDCEELDNEDYDAEYRRTA